VKGDLLRINNLRTYFFTTDGVVKAVDGVNLSIGTGEVLGLVGESGSGKTVTALSIMRLVPSPPGRIVGGSIVFKDEDLLEKTEKEMRKVRGAGIAMSFQDPMTYLNPVHKIGDQIVEAIKLHQDVDEKEAWESAMKYMELVRIPSGRERLNDYPHQFSGGMRQRILIAMALSCHPSLLIADEPTTALDLITQREILELLTGLKEEIKFSMLLITHDLGTVCELADRVAVMYAGKVVEYADKLTMFKEPGHPYTEALLASIPTLEVIKEKTQRLRAINGVPPDMTRVPPGCRFHPRCPYASESCSISEPGLIHTGTNHFVACFKKC